MVKETDSKQISTKVIKISRDCSKYSEENRWMKKQKSK